MAVDRRLRPATLFPVALLLAGCGAAPGATPDVPTSARDAEAAAVAACAELDVVPLGGADTELVETQVAGFTAAAEHVRTAADADPAYADEAEEMAEMAARAREALAILEENGEDPDTWPDDVQRAWGAYAMDQAAGLMLVVRFCNEVDPPAPTSGERRKEDAG